MPDEGTSATQRAAAATVSRALVSLHKQFYGKGPVRAKTHLVNDTVLCDLEGGFTVVERTLIEVGRAPAVHDIRTSFQARCASSSPRSWRRRLAARSART
jgi:uncharacterized protein YbcI